MGAIDWLLEGDPAIRWQVLRDLTGASPDEVAAERARVEHEGWAPASWRSGATAAHRLERRRCHAIADIGARANREILPAPVTGVGAGMLMARNS
jgi:hypothetical protein